MTPVTDWSLFQSRRTQRQRLQRPLVTLDTKFQLDWGSQLFVWASDVAGDAGGTGDRLVGQIEKLGLFFW